jgi:hypothetical protein
MQRSDGKSGVVGTALRGLHLSTVSAFPNSPQYPYWEGDFYGHGGGFAGGHGHR